MPQTLRPNPMGLVPTTPVGGQDPPDGFGSSSRKGFGGAGQSRSGRRKGGRKRTPALSKADWGPLGKHPDREAIVAWKSAAAEHHPDRGGSHDTMQRVNGARDLLLGRSSD